MRHYFWPIVALIALLVAVGRAQLQQPTLAASVFRTAASTATQAVKASPGNLYGWYIYNPNASVCFADLFDLASASVSLGSSTPAISLGIPGSSAANISPNALAVANFGAAISVASVTATGGASTCATGMVVNLWYQ